MSIVTMSWVTFTLCMLLIHPHNHRPPLYLLVRLYISGASESWDQGFVIMAFVIRHEKRTKWTRDYYCSCLTPFTKKISSTTFWDSAAATLIAFPAPVPTIWYNIGIVICLLHTCTELEKLGWVLWNDCKPVCSQPTQKLGQILPDKQMLGGITCLCSCYI